MVEKGQKQHKIGPKRMKFKEIEEKGEVDRVSALPDCLLVEILSRLPSTKNSFSTCILSKRWKHLWTLVHTLVFTHLDYDSLRPRGSDFFTFVDKTLTQRPQSKLKKLHVEAIHDIPFESQVNNWICYALSCNVEELILKLYSWGTGSVCQLDQFFYISSCFTDLTLQGCILNPTGAISWKNLRSLCIIRGKLGEDLIENILTGSPVLETLELCVCYGFRRLNITSKSVKKLVFSYNDRVYEGYNFDEIIEINAPSISSLTIENSLLLWKLLLLNMTSLIEAELDFFNHPGMPYEVEEEMLKGFIVNLCHVKELKIGVRCSKVLSRLVANGFDLPSNIKFLDGAYERMQQGDSSESESESEFKSESESESESESKSESESESESELEFESESDEDN